MCLPCPLPSFSHMVSHISKSPVSSPCLSITLAEALCRILAWWQSVASASTVQLTLPPATLAQTDTKARPCHAQGGPEGGGNPAPVFVCLDWLRIEVGWRLTDGGCQLAVKRRRLVLDRRRLVLSRRRWAMNRRWVVCRKEQAGVRGP